MSLSGATQECCIRICISLDPPRVRIDCRSLGKNSVLEGTAAQERKVEWKNKELALLRLLLPSVICSWFSRTPHACL